jgi:hypothetical protein
LPSTCQDQSKNEVKYRSETIRINLQLVKIEAKTNLVRSLGRSKTKLTAFP